MSSLPTWGKRAGWVLAAYFAVNIVLWLWLEYDIRVYTAENQQCEETCRGGKGICYKSPDTGRFVCQ